MTNETVTFRKVFIRSESDLPKEGSYISCRTNNFVGMRRFTLQETMPYFNYSKQWWLENIDWYLAPIEHPSPDLLTKEQEVNKEVSEAIAKVHEAIEGRYDLNGMDLMELQGLLCEFQYHKSIEQPSEAESKDTETRECGVCWGGGKIEVDDLGKEESCFRCHGTGRIPTRKAVHPQPDKEQKTAEETLKDFLDKDEAKNAMVTGNGCYLSEEDVIILMKRFAYRNQSLPTITEKEVETPKCQHPPENQKLYHDGAIMCTKCNCIISQYGKMFKNPSPLGMEY